MVNATLGQQASDTTRYDRLSKLSVFSVDYLAYPAAGYDTRSGRGEISFNEIITIIQAVVPIKPQNFYFSSGLEHVYLLYENELNSQQIDRRKEFHSFSFSLGLIKVWPKRWRFILNFSPTLASDFIDPLSSDDFIWQASVLGMKRANRNFEYGFGISYTTRFGSGLLIPVINATHRHNRWVFRAVLPSYMTEFYNISKNTQLGIRLGINGNVFNASYPGNSSPFDLNRVSYSRINIGPSFQTKLLNDFYLNLTSSVTIRNIMEIQNNDLDTELDFAVDNKFFFNLGIRLLK